MKRIYLDYAASSPVATEVEAVMRSYFLNKFGNAGSLHSFGQEAIAALDESRETIANAVGANFREIIFTGSATEANNLALRGALKGFRVSGLGSSVKKSLNPSGYTLTPRIIVSAIEHESILETARDLEKEGAEIIYLPVSKKGIINLKKLKEFLNERTILVSVMYANNEIGTIQPISEIAKIISDFRKQMTNNKEQIAKNKSIRHKPLAINHWPLLHTDAVQAFQFLDCDVKKLGVDLMTLSGHKIYGPKGVGALYIANRVLGLGSNVKKSLNPSDYTLTPIITGGGQEFGLRSGTENIPLIVGFAEAVELATNNRAKEAKRIGALRDYLWKGIKNMCPKAERNGDTKKVLPNFLNVYFPDYNAADLLVRLDLAGIAVSAGSACSARSSEPSYVIEALGLKGKRSSRSIRITLGRQTSRRDIDTALKIIKNITKR